jgi:hypothetical protein
MKSNYKQIIIVSLILLLGIFLRVFMLGKVPASPDWDEVALGYNAYSILETGKDEYGKTFPLVLESFDDYKPALYAYLVIPFVKVLGLTVYAVRLPSVIFGCLSLLALYFLVRELFPRGIEYGRVKIGRDIFAGLSMLFLAISPWHIQFSRVAFEAQVGLSFNLIAILLFLKGFRKPYLLIFSFIVAALSLYVYQSEKVYVPLLFTLLIAVFWKQFWSISKKWIAFSFIAGFIVVLPMLAYIISNPNALTRAKGVSVFSDTTKLLSNNTAKIERDRENSNYLGLVLDNRRIEYSKAFMSGYLSHFEPNWLFYRGDELRHQPPYMGLLYIFELPLILVGLYILIFSKIDRKIKIFVVGYILISPIPASVTYDVPHAVRTINMLPAVQIISAIGFLYLLYIVNKTRSFTRIPILIIGTLIISVNISYYLNQYFVQMNYYYSKAWQYGWEDAVKYAQENEGNFDRVVVSNISPLDQSYMFFLFYSKYDPKKYLEEGGTRSGGFSANHTAFGKYIFRPINWNEDKLSKNTLFIGRPEDLPDNIGKTLYYLNGESAIVFSEKHE